jgi:polyisoprenyl-phosphate glycosyltransferase
MSYELICVDDGSSDGTREVLETMADVRTILLPRNQGSGTARRIGTQQARGRVVVWTDADLTYPNERIPELVAHLDDTWDQVVGARRSEAGTYKLARVPAKWAIRKLASFLTNADIPDLNSGLRAFKRSVAEPYLRLLPAGFSCVTTITLAFLSNGHPVKYVPIDYFKRAGRSKFHPLRDAYNYIIQVLRMVMYFNPLRVLMPVGLALLAATFLKAGVDLVVHHWHVASSTVLVGLAGFNIMAIALLADLVVRRTGPD